MVTACFLAWGITVIEICISQLLAKYITVIGLEYTKYLTKNDSIAKILSPTRKRTKQTIHTAFTNQTKKQNQHTLSQHNQYQHPSTTTIINHNINRSSNPLFLIWINNICIKNMLRVSCCPKITTQLGLETAMPTEEESRAFYIRLTLALYAPMAVPSQPTWKVGVPHMRKKFWPKFTTATQSVSY